MTDPKQEHPLPQSDTEHSDLRIEEQERELEKINQYFDMQNEAHFQQREIEKDF